MNICESLTVTAKIFPDRTAIIFGDVSFSYAALNQRSIAAATVLRERGIGPGDRVALMLPNTPSFAIWYYAVLRIGAIAVSIGTRLAHSEVEFTVSDCAAKAFIAGESAAELIRSLPETVELALPVADVDGDVCSSGFSRNSEDFYHWISQRRHALPRQRAFQRSRIQSSLQHAARRCGAARGATVSLFRPKRIT